VVRPFVSTASGLRFRLKSGRNVVQWNKPPGGETLAAYTDEASMFSFSINVRIAVSTRAVALFLYVLLIWALL
jgi:hypothetical protein